MIRGHVSHQGFEVGRRIRFKQGGKALAAAPAPALFLPTLCEEPINVNVSKPLPTHQHVPNFEDDYMYDDGGRLTAQQESDYMDYCATESEHERPYDADACQCDLDQCFIDDMWAAECDLCEGNIGCKHCCGDGGEIEDTCGTCEGYGGCYDCCFTGKRSGCGTGKCEYCKARPGADEHDEATFLCASETQALREAQVTF
eukprot:COSAG01_NODE_1629_length_9679_cov_19.357829_1_plen_199_part_10